MAQSGFTPILLYSSSTASQAPSAGNLTNSTLGSELAINITDGKLFYKDNANNVQVIGWKTVPTTAGGTGLTSYTAGDLVYYASGTTLTKLAIGAANTVLTSSGTAPQWSTSITLSDNATAAAFIPSGSTVPTNGMYLPATNTVAWSTNSNRRMGITAAGQVLVGGTTSINDAPGNLTLNPTGNIGQLNLFRDDTSVILGNPFGYINFYGNDTTSNTPTKHAFIQADASGTHAAGDNPTDLVFGTTPDNTDTVAEAGRITQAGAYVLKGGSTSLAAGVGIVFPATQVASADANCLDDYEEGTWTVEWFDAATGGNLSSTTTTGYYTKIGRSVQIHFAQANINTTGLTAGNTLYFTLPITAASTGEIIGSGMLRAATWPNTSGATQTVQINSYLASGGAARGSFQASATAYNSVAVTVGAMTSGTSDIYVQMTYPA
jgi:hypothetical protein